MEYVPRKPTRKKIITIVATVSCVLIVGGISLALFLDGHKSASLMPKQLANMVQYTPYFYFGTIPRGYAVGTTQTDGEVIMISLVKKDKPTIVLTEQALPEDFDANSLQKDGNRVEGTKAPATISQITGRLVGTMIDNKNNVLVLLNTTSSSDKEDLSALLSGLRLTR